jgi:hypothetical protein
MKIYNELESLGFFEWLSETHNLKDTDMTPECLDELLIEDIHRTVCNSMAFRWFREKHNLVIQYIPHEIYDDNDQSNLHHKYKISEYDSWRGGRRNTVETELNENYEEAEFECIEKLIEIIQIYQYKF